MTDPVAAVWRDEWGRLLALLVARTRRLDLSEDALAEAFEAATRHWPTQGVPDNPAAWLFTTARRRVLDRLRAEAIAARTMPRLAIDEQLRGVDRDPGADVAALERAEAGGDDVLRLVLLAAHPALTLESGAALTLRLVLGITTPDIARLFLVGESTMAARLTRARKKVVAAGVPLAIPAPDVLPERLDVVAQVAYLAYTAGYAPGSGPDVVRVELAGEAIRLVRVVLGTSRVAAASPSLRSLLALMLLQHSRRAARTDDDGAPVLLGDQDRRRWRTDEISEGLALLATVPASSPIPPSPLAESYRLQALIAAEHARAATPADTDWGAIAARYAELDALTGSPVVRMNRAVAVAEAGDLTAALGLLDGLDAQLPHSHRLPAVQAELRRRAGDTDRAVELLDVAIARCDNDAERAALISRRAALIP